jgi:hypothetical protein
MEWGVNPAIQHRGPVGLVLSAFLLLVIPGVPLFFAGYWAVHGFLADPTLLCPQCGTHTPVLRSWGLMGMDASQEAYFSQFRRCANCFGEWNPKTGFILHRGTKT